MSPDAKAVQRIEALRQVGRTHRDFVLDLLGAKPVPRALAELERLPGVGRKTAASALNLSMLRRPVLVVDTHVARVQGRLGLEGDAPGLSAAVTMAMADRPGERFVAFHRQLIRLGRAICRWDVPRCGRRSRRAGCTTAQRPRRRAWQDRCAGQ